MSKEDFESACIAFYSVFQDIVGCTEWAEVKLTQSVSNTQGSKSHAVVETLTKYALVV